MSVKTKSKNKKAWLQLQKEAQAREIEKMNHQLICYADYEADALSVLQNDVIEVLERFVEENKILDFWVPNDIWGHISHEMFVYDVKLKSGQIMKLLFSFLKKETETPFIKREEKLFLNLMLNKQKSYPFMIGEILTERIGVRAGLLMEVYGYEILVDYIKTHPRGPLKSVRMSTEKEDKVFKKDLIIEFQYKNQPSFSFGIDIKSSAKAMREEIEKRKIRKRKKHLGYLVSFTRSNLKNPKQWVKDVIKIGYYHAYANKLI